jgi:hypothetical protein
MLVNDALGTVTSRGYVKCFVPVAPLDIDIPIIMDCLKSGRGIKDRLLGPFRMIGPVDNVQDFRVLSWRSLVLTVFIVEAISPNEAARIIPYTKDTGPPFNSAG